MPSTLCAAVEHTQAPCRCCSLRSPLQGRSLARTRPPPHLLAAASPVRHGRSHRRLAARHSGGHGSRPGVAPAGKAIMLVAATAERERLTSTTALRRASGSICGTNRREERPGRVPNRTAMAADMATCTRRPEPHWRLSVPHSRRPPPARRCFQWRRTTKKNLGVEVYF